MAVVFAATVIFNKFLFICSPTRCFAPHLPNQSTHIIWQCVKTYQLRISFRVCYRSTHTHSPKFTENRFFPTLLLLIFLFLFHFVPFLVSHFFCPTRIEFFFHFRVCIRKKTHPHEPLSLSFSLPMRNFLPKEEDWHGMVGMEKDGLKTKRLCERKSEWDRARKKAAPFRMTICPLYGGLLQQICFLFSQTFIADFGLISFCRLAMKWWHIEWFVADAVQDHRIFFTYYISFLYSFLNAQWNVLHIGLCVCVLDGCVVDSQHSLFISVIELVWIANLFHECGANYIILYYIVRTIRTYTSALRAFCGGTLE